MVNAVCNTSSELIDFISYLVTFSKDNVLKLSSLLVNSDNTSLISNIFNYIEKNRSNFNLSDKNNSFQLFFSEFLTFSFLSFYLTYPSTGYNDLLINYESSTDILVSDIFRHCSKNEINHLFSYLNFPVFYSYLSKINLDKIIFLGKDIFKIIHEHFLLKFNTTVKKKSGIYYTPDEAIEFICNSILTFLFGNFLKKSSFEGTINILDPSCGTGSFLLEFVKQYGKKIDNRINFNLKPTITGFDVNPVAYLLAKQNFNFLNMKTLNPLSASIYNISPIAFLKDLDENTTDSDYFRQNFQALNNLRLNTNAFQIVLGNPPYSAVSNNSNIWINNLLKGVIPSEKKISHNYFEVDGESINEKKSGWLYDDYVKFIRLGHWLIDKSGQGILSYICNNGFLSNPSFRGMRFQLISTFDEFYILNIHGNKKIDKTPDNVKDENLFPITQGVCLFLFIKNSNSHPLRKTFYHYDLWGLKPDKQDFLRKNTIFSLDWKEFIPTKPFYNFVPEDLKYKNLYINSWSIKDIFKIKGTGLITSKDQLTLQFTKEDLITVIQDFTSLAPEIARAKYNLGPDTENWKVKSAQKDILDLGISESAIAKVLYRPFDHRYTFYTGNANGFHGRPKSISEHLFQRNNISLISARSNKTGNNDHFFVSSTLTEAKCAESSTQSYIFPLKIFDATNFEKDNLNPDFIHELVSIYNIKYNGTCIDDYNITSRDILAYIYALFYSYEYRQIFKSFLFFDFPKVPFVSDILTFKELIRLGHDLISVHLLEFVIPTSFDVQTNFKSNGMVKSISYKDQNLFINKSDFFYPIDYSIYSFTIGNYRVLKKWLEGRKNLVLSNIQLEEFKKVIYAIQKTLEIISSINFCMEKVKFLRR